MGHIRVDPPNTNNKWVGFGLANVDTFIIRVGFGLANVDTIHTLTRHEHDPLTRIATPTRMGSRVPQPTILPHMRSLLWINILRRKLCTRYLSMNLPVSQSYMSL